MIQGFLFLSISHAPYTLVMMPFFSFITSGHLLSFLPKKMNSLYRMPYKKPPNKNIMPLCRRPFNNRPSLVIPDPIGNPVALFPPCRRLYVRTTAPLPSFLTSPPFFCHSRPTLFRHSRQAKRDRESSGKEASPLLVPLISLRSSEDDTEKKRASEDNPVGKHHSKDNMKEKHSS